MSSQIIIGFCGKAGAGKSTAAAYLARTYGFERVRFAGPLKAMLAALGCSPDEIDGSAKELPCDLLGGRTPRQAMQTLGTEWGRHLVTPDLWTRAWIRAAEGKSLVVADDVRFANEADLIRGRGGIVVEIFGDEAGSSSGAGHVSERMAFAPDLRIFNPRNHGFFPRIDVVAHRQMVRGRRHRAATG